jgi:hypothetical protein
MLVSFASEAERLKAPGDRPYVLRGETYFGFGRAHRFRSAETS